MTTLRTWLCARLLFVCMLTVCGLGARVAVAQHGAAPAEEVEDSDSDVRYVTLQPTFVTNYGSSETGRLKYLKADVTVRVPTRDAEMAVRYHLPALRNDLVLLFSRQEEHALTTSEGREQLRQEALAELRGVMKQEEGQSSIDDLVFDNFVVQR